MAFSDIVDLAKQSATEQERRRKEELTQLAERQKLAHSEDETTGVTGYATQNPHAALAPGAERELDQQRMLNSAADKRFTERRDAITSEDPATPDSQLSSWFGPEVASMLKETPQERDDELAVNPRGRATRLEGVKAQLAQRLGLSGAGSDRPISVGTGTHGEPYYTNLRPDELVAEGAPIQMQSTESGPQPELHRVSGGGGGSFSSTTSGFADRGAGGDPEDVAKSDLLRSLGLEIDAARNAKLTPQEKASQLNEQEPVWSQQFATNGYGGGTQALRKALADGVVHPDVATYMQKKADLAARSASKDPQLGFDTKEFGKQMLLLGGTAADTVAPPTTPGPPETDPSQTLGVMDAARQAHTTGGPGSSPRFGGALLTRDQLLSYLTQGQFGQSNAGGQ